MTPDATEQHRHRCEVRWCIRQGPEWCRRYLAGVAERRGRDAARRLLRDIQEQARAGNDGTGEAWIDVSTEP